VALLKIQVLREVVPHNWEQRTENKNTLRGIWCLHFSSIVGPLDLENQDNKLL
jgi:hypothetical protein